ncbi:MAG: thiamine-phosphate kinase [Nitrospiraceae bacterium]|nr:MAG: thiamine-phosphate kinase [Nitrospiraceae bacterium]
MKLSSLGEFGLIGKLRVKCPALSPDIVAGIGDDAAVIRPGTGECLITTDMLLEGVHFDLSYTTMPQLGYKFLAVNVSDIFAMGGRPEHFLTGMGVPGGIDSRDMSGLYDGIRKAASQFGVSVIGGDTCASQSGLVLSGTLLGRAKKAVLRSGARPGDGIFLSGTVGDSAMGLHLLKKRGKKVHRFSPAADRLVLMKKHLMPRPRPVTSMAGISAMIDVSDGLLADLCHICDESTVGAIIYTERIPLSPHLRNTAQFLGMNPFPFALNGGEDYVLLFTASRNYKGRAFRIGEITHRGRYIADSRGKKKPFRPEGYEHFKSH